MSKNKILLSVFFTLLIVSGSVYAGDWQTILKGIKDKYAGYQDKIKDIMIIRENRLDTPEGEITSDSKTYKKGIKFRNEMVMEMPNMPQGMPAIKTIVIYDGEDTWMISPFMGKKKLSADQARGYKRQEDWWTWLSENGELVGSEKIDDQDCYIVKLDIEKTPYSRIWITKEDFAVIKAEFKDKDKSGVIRFSDYKELSGFAFPYRIDIYMEGEHQALMLVKSAEVNTGLSDELFDPDKVEMPDMQEMMKYMQKGAGTE